jgi:pimeloyl-ACP methyl ester carboxylesterase
MPAPLTLLDSVSPAAAARLAYPLLVTPGPRLKLRPADAPTMEEARTATLKIRGRRVVSYEWGSGSSVVLLVHGWRGRASQFASLVRELRYAGHTVVAFDAPACGASEGSRTDAGDYVEAMRALQSRYGAFSGVVGHSFGSLVGLVALNEGFTAARFAGIASIPDAGSLMTSFSERVGLGSAANDHLVRRFQRLRFSDGPDMLERFSGVRNPVAVPTLFVHDADDREVPVAASEALHAAHGATSTLVVTRGQGHVRVLGADEALDEVVGFLAAEPALVRGAAL